MKTFLIRLGLLLCLLFPAIAEARTQTSLNAGWAFIRQDIPAAKDAAFDAGGWQKVDLPHSFNAHDVRSASDRDAIASPNGYYRGPAWYRRALDLTPVKGQHYYLQFDGATLVADVYVNGRSVGRHEGGYAAFRFDITDALKAGGNVIAVRVDNTKVAQVAPLNGDFNVSGGLTRGVSLVAVPDVHVDLTDHGGPGVYVSTQEMSESRADIAVRSLLANDGAKTSAMVRTRILDADGKVVVQSTHRQALASGVATVDQVLTIRRPHLWQGRQSPYLYRVEVAVADDIVAVPLGVRTIATDPNKGLLLNGRPYGVHGVNMQQPGRPGKGTAVSDADIDADMQMLDDLGATGLRLAHMQHPQRVYDDADHYGFIVTTEVPLVNEVTADAAFHDNIVEQLRELIAQNYNHPSVAMWGLGNELWDNSDAANALMADLQKTAKAMDPKRPTVYSHCCLADDAAIATHADVTSFNRYYGWYSGEFADLGKWADAVHARFPDRVFGISEYGAGASIKAQEDPAGRPATTSYWHPEQYQAAYHEANWKQLSARPWLWSDYIWVAFDFPAYARNEGDRPGMNDKGLISEDRSVKKDAYFWYQANWSDRLMVHISSPRYAHRRTRNVTVKIYANVDEVRLSLNGESLGAQTVVDHVATWKVTLKDGDNVVEAFAGKDLHDIVHWTYSDRVE